MSQPHRIALVTPHYGPVSVGLHHTLRHASLDRTLLAVATELQCSTSVLPDGFNRLLAACLDLRDQGFLTHMAMVHADIAAAPGWLDVLYREMRDRGDVVVATVIAVKSTEGVTSTAFGLADDPWAPALPLGLEARPNMPETFAIADACACKPGAVLLVNTGLMLVDLTHPFWDSFSFEFHTRIVRGDDGKRYPQHVSEDWDMSRKLHAAGVPYSATWKPEVRHEGAGVWLNRVPS